MVLLVVLGRFGWFWVVLGRFGWFWLVPCFSNYAIKNSQAIPEMVYRSQVQRLVYAGLRLQIYKVFQDRLTILNRQKILWFSWD